MASTVNIPLLGPTNKGTAVGIGLGGLAVAGFMIYRYEKKAKAQAAAVAASQQQQQQTAQASAGYGAYGAGYYGYGEPQSYYGYGASGGFNAGYYGYGVAQPQTAASTTDAQWTQAAISQLTSEGYDAQTVSTALGAYVTGQQVSSAQQTIIQSAIGIEGYPPVAGANGYPPSIHVQPTAGGGTGGGQTGPTGTTVPNVMGLTGSQAIGVLTASGFKYNLNGPATGKVWSQTPQGGYFSLATSTNTVDIATR